MGLKEWRGAKGKVPTHKCDNCGKVRYVKCTCTRQEKGAKNEETGSRINND